MLMVLSKNRRRKLREGFFARLDALRVSLPTTEPILFIDAGANIGQGFRWFSSIFTSSMIHFDLFEPNPTCLAKLHETLGGEPRIRSINGSAISTSEGEVEFFGTSDKQWGAMSVGGSIEDWHNAIFYDARAEKGILVPTIDFGAYLEAQANTYRRIIVKMDIEGSELIVLETLISRGQHRLINTIYVEFHSIYADPALRRALAEREAKICARLRVDGVRVRIWH